MKKMMVMFWIAGLFTATQARAQDFDLQGSWKTIEKEVAITEIKFGAQDSLRMLMHKEWFGGKDFKNNGSPANLTYKADFNFNPARLDIIIYETETKNTSTVRGLIMILKPGVIKIALNLSNGERPKDFTRSNSGVFKKETP